MFGAAGAREAAQAEIRQLLASPELRRIFSETKEPGPARGPGALVEARGDCGTPAFLHDGRTLFSPLVILAAIAFASAWLLPTEMGPGSPQRVPVAPLQRIWQPPPLEVLVRDEVGRMPTARSDETSPDLVVAAITRAERASKPAALLHLTRPSAGEPLAVAPRRAEPSPREAEAALGADRRQRGEVQRRLALAGFSPQGIDGIFGERTRAAISDWQRNAGLAPTGFLDRDQVALLSRQTDAAYERFMRGQT